MKNNIIKDDREISMKAESMFTDTSNDTESIGTIDSSVGVSQQLDTASAPAIASPLENHHPPTKTFEQKC